MHCSIRIATGAFFVACLAIVPYMAGGQPSRLTSGGINKSLPGNRNINNAVGVNLQDVKRATVYIYYKKITDNNGWAGATGILLNTVTNTFSNGLRTFYILTAAHVITEDPANYDIYLSFNYEMPDNVNRGTINENNFITRVYKIPLLKVVEDMRSEISLYKVDLSQIDLEPLSELTGTKVAFYNAYAAGWTLHPELSLNSLVNISHPQGDHKKVFVWQSDFKLLSGCNLNELRVRDRAFVSVINVDERPESGSSGSPWIEKKTNLVSSVHWGTSDGIYSLSSLLENSWVNSEGTGLMNFLDGNNTWISKVEGGYIKDLIPPETTNFEKNFNGDEVATADMMLGFHPLYVYGLNPLKRETLLGSGMIVNSGTAKLYITVTPKDDPEYLFYGVSADPAVPSQTQFKGDTWNLSNPPEEGLPGRSNMENLTLLSCCASQQSGDLKKWVTRYLTKKSRASPFVSWLALGPQSQDLDIPVEIKVFRIDDASVSTLKAVKLPYFMPYNAVQLFEPSQLSDAWKSKKYRPLRGLSADQLFINSLSVTQDSQRPWVIATGNNGGYLNLVNPNFLIGPIKTSYSSGADVEKNEIIFNIDVANSLQGGLFYYKIWMDFFPETDADNYYNFVGDPHPHDFELLDEGSGSAALRISVPIPDNGTLKMAPNTYKICRMRIAVSNSYGVIQDGRYQYGEVEDYLLDLYAPERKTAQPELDVALEGTLVDIAGPPSLSVLMGTGSGYDGNRRRLGTSSLRFGGNSDYVSLDENDLFIHKAFTARTIALWVYCENNSGFQDIYDEGDNTNGIGLRINNGNIELGVQNANRIQKVAGAMPTNQWVFVTGMFNNGKLSLYIDGALAAENANVGFTSVPIHAGAAGLGATNGTNAFDQANNNFNGWIDELKIYNIALLESEIEFMSGTGTINAMTSGTPGVVQAEAQRDGNLVTDNHPKSPELVVFPNPSKGDINIITEVKQAGPIAIRIIDITGRLVYEKTFSGVGTGFQHIALKNLQLKTATYIVKVVNKGNEQTGKLVVEN
ncbi:MAG: LamG-like jellyroll fold domain-containing protein [Bacteroidota bacterium]